MSTLYGVTYGTGASTVTTSGSLIEYNVQWLYDALVPVSKYGGPGRLVTDKKYAHVPVVNTVVTGSEYRGHRW